MKLFYLAINKIFLARLFAGLFVVFSVVIPMSVYAASTAGSVTNLYGRASAMSANGDIRNLSKNSKIHSNETITTTDHTHVRIKLKDESYIMLRPNSRFVIENFRFQKNDKDRGFFTLLKGGFRTVSGLIRNKLKYRYRTTVATIGIRGTGFMVRMCNADCFDIDPVPPDGLFLEVTDKTVVLTNGAGSFTYNAGQFVYIAGGNTPAVTLSNRPNVFVQSPIPPADPDNCSE